MLLRTMAAVGAAALVSLAIASGASARTTIGSSLEGLDLGSAVPYAGGHAIADAYGWDGAAAPGDSGSAVRVSTGNQAAGNLTHLVVDSSWLPSFIVGTRIGKMQSIAGRPLANSGLC